MRRISYRRSIVFCIVTLFVMISAFPMTFGAYSNTQYSTSICLVDENDYFIKNTDFTVTITKPKEGYLYINDAEQRETIIDDVRPHIIGPITVEASVIGGEGGIKKVEFYKNDMLEIDDTEAPYTWYWNSKLAIGEIIIKVRAYDNNNNFVEDSVTVLILQIQNA